MPHSDTVVMRRQNYILDLDEFARTEPRVAAFLQTFDVNELGPRAWGEKLTALWRDIDDVSPLLNEQTRSAFMDLSTTYYTVNKYRMELIRIRDANEAESREVPEAIRQHREEYHTRRNDGV